MPNLPIDLWQAILDASTATDRIRLRAVDKTLCALSTPMVFRSMRFSNNSKDTKIFKHVQMSPEIAKLVKEIVIVIRDQEQLTWGTAGNKSGFKRHPNALIFAKLSNGFPSLCRLDISFDEAIAAYTFKLRRHILGQLQIIETVLCGARDSLLTSLSINQIFTLPDYFLSSRSMADIFASLTSLEVSFVFFNDEHDIADHPYHLDPVRLPGGGLYHPKDFPSHLGISQWGLTRLKLASELEVAYFEPLDFSALHFPNLTSLVIEKMTFRSPSVDLPVDAAGSLENFIVRHSTLQRLVLKNCLICYLRGGGRRYWSTVYDRVAQGLTRLVELSIEFGPLEPNWYEEEDEGPESWLEEGQEVKDLSLGYAMPDDVVSTYNKRFLRGYIHTPEVVERDIAALCRLYAAVEERSRK
ncbi:hypothetical protein PILCRDRAFT_818023 [Piloderma croceum F 1598]|uniref:F-box domain-containing protein n=1 Tax=Piloderma croceum (strain F 1598) TaxID=765440 RepID=A0A0C3FXX9_PILCF|nr:hypothetical protein PILCRDRAFT_818023 [Piloderma croceum F 1598]